MTSKKRRIIAAVYEAVKKMEGPEDAVLFNEEIGVQDAGVHLLDRGEGRTYRIIVQDVTNRITEPGSVVGEESRRRNQAEGESLAGPGV